MGLKIFTLSYLQNRMNLDILSRVQKAQYLDIRSIGNVAIVKNGCTVTVLEEITHTSI